MWDLSSHQGWNPCPRCIARQILNHWTTREVSLGSFWVGAWSKLLNSTGPIIPSQAAPTSPLLCLPQPRFFLWSRPDPTCGSGDSVCVCPDLFLLPGAHVDLLKEGRVPIPILGNQLKNGKNKYTFKQTPTVTLPPKHSDTRKEKPSHESTLFYLNSKYEIVLQAFIYFWDMDL